MQKLILLFIPFLFFISCSNDEDLKIPKNEVGQVSFSFSEQTNNEITGTSSKNLVDLIPSAIYINIIDANDQEIIDYQKLPLLSFGSEYTTNPLELSIGDYEITTFNIVDANDVVIYASPMAGSENAEYVDNPLPIAFSVSTDQTTTISPEVILVAEDSTPEEFGFASFSFTVVDILDEIKTQDLYLSVNEFIGEEINEVQANFLINIESEDFSLDGVIYLDHIPVTIPLTYDGDNVKITIIYADYTNQIFYLNAEQISTYSENEPFEVYFEQ